MSRKPAAAIESHDLRIRVIAAMSEIAAADWDRCAGGGEMAGGPNPFTRHAFLAALETSKSATARTGWQPQHLVAESTDGTIIGVAPCYLKSHSRGEYVFDAGWADAYERAGGSYYPKLQVSVPFTPATGRRLLVAPGQPAGVAEAALAQGLIALCKLCEASSVHATFMTQAEWDLLGQRGFLRRNDQQFHWENGGFSCFEDFLAALASRKRKVIKRERREGLADGIKVDWLTGSDLTEAAWDAFFAFYTETGSRKWGRPYLTRAFFSRLGETMADQTVLIMAKRAGRYIADPALRRAIDDYLARERAYVEAAGHELREASPFRKDVAHEDAGF